jgi:hypothetical protein
MFKRYFRPHGDSPEFVVRCYRFPEHLIEVVSASFAFPHGIRLANQSSVDTQVLAQRGLAVDVQLFFSPWLISQNVVPAGRSPMLDLEKKKTLLHLKRKTIQQAA